MIHNKFRYLLTLVALFALTAGAWAEETATITLKCGTTEKTYENVTLPWSTTADILKEVISDYKNVASNIDAITGGDGKVVKYGNEQFTVNGTFSGEATVVVSWYNSSKQYATITVTAPGPLLTLNEAKTEATMESMPASDVTIEYELVRDMSVQMTAQVGDGTQEQPRYRVKKDGNNKFIPADMEMAAVPALFTVNDAIEQKALTQTQDYIVQIYAIDAEGQPTGDPMTFATFTFEPGIYAVKAVAADGSDYDGETALSNTFRLFQGYEVEIAANGFATYYKDEPLKVDESTPSGELYTISSVSASSAVLSEQIEASPSSTPLIVFNNSEETKVILLIPMAEEPNLALTVAPEFKGTNESKTFSADEMSAADHYVLRDTQFVWVKNAGTIGANKCWLEIASGSPEARSIVFGDATGISEAVSVSDDSWYDLNGRKISKPVRKGVYIINGRKVVVK